MQSQLMPHNVEAEESALGSIIIDPAALARVAPILDAGDFYVQKNAWVYEALLAVKAAAQPIDLVTLCDELERRGQLEPIGGAAYITHLINAVPSAIHADAYAKIVAQRAEGRRLIEAASTIAQLGYQDDADQAERAALVRAAAEAATRRRVGAEAMGGAAAANRLFELADGWAREPLKPGEVRGTSTGLLDLDAMLGGLGSGLYLVGAVQHTGKTALCDNLELRIARQGKPCLDISMEHTAEQKWLRLASQMCGIDLREIQAGLSGDKYGRFIDALAEIESLPLEIIGQQLSLAQVQGEVESRPGLGFCAVDNIELAMRSLNGKEADYIRLRNAAYWLLAIAQSNGVPLFTTMQISSKACAQRNDKRPRIEDLYGSDGPSQAASVVLLLHRDDRWLLDDGTPALKGKLDNTIEVMCWKDKVNYCGAGQARRFQFWHQGQIRNLDKTPKAPPEPPESWENGAYGR